MAGVGPKPPAPPDEQILSEAERREVLALVQDNNISMDFILEMKEAFLLFDKVLEIFKPHLIVWPKKLVMSCH